MAKRKTKTSENGSNTKDQKLSIDDFLEEIGSRLVTVGTVPVIESEAPVVEAVERMQVITFTLGGDQFAIDVENIGEVVREPRITPVPGLSDWVVGVTNLHGEIVSVVDLSRFLNIGQIELAQHSMVLQAHAGDQKIGLLVDNVGLIYSFPVEQIMSPPFKVSMELVAYLRGVVDRDNTFVRLLDCESLLLGSQMQQFS